MKQLAGWLKRRFNTTNTFGIPVHIAVEPIAGRINQKMYDKKNQQCPCGIGPHNLAERKPINGHQKKRKVKSQ
jgi:hypothetical protein